MSEYSLLLLLSLSGIIVLLAIIGTEGKSRRTQQRIAAILLVFHAIVFAVDRVIGGMATCNSIIIARDAPREAGKGLRRRATLSRPTNPQMASGVEVEIGETGIRVVGSDTDQWIDDRIRWQSVESLEFKSVVKERAVESELWAIATSGNTFLALTERDAVSVFNDGKRETLNAPARISFTEPIHLNGVELLYDNLYYLYFDGQMSKISAIDHSRESCESWNLSGISVCRNELPGTGWQGLDVVQVEISELQKWAHFESDPANNHRSGKVDVFVATNSTKNLLVFFGIEPYTSEIQPYGRVQLENLVTNDRAHYFQGAAIVGDEKLYYALPDAVWGNVSLIPTSASSADSVTVLACHASEHGAKMGGNRPYLEGVDGVGNRVVVSSREGKVWLFDLKKLKQTPRFVSLPLFAHMQDIALNPNDMSIVGADNQSLITASRVWLSDVWMIPTWLHEHHVLLLYVLLALDFALLILDKRSPVVRGVGKLCGIFGRGLVKLSGRLSARTNFEEQV